MPDDGLPHDPDLAVLGQRFRDELRADAEADEELAARDRLRVRTLGDVALELLHRGDVVAVEIGERSFTGTVIYTARDLACLRTAAGVVDVRLSAPLTLRILERVRDGGQPRGRGASSFAARLAEHELNATPVELVGAGGIPGVAGRITALASDHALVAGPAGNEVYVALTAIAAAVVRDA